MTSRLPKLELPQYFEGQRLTAAGLNADALTERERRWFHNRALHGSGISTGLVVSAADSGKEVIVQPGHAIDPVGRDLIVTTPTPIQVPPVAGTNGQARRFVVVVRWPDEAEPVRATGPCDAEGAVGLPEQAVAEIVPEDAVGEAVPLAVVEVLDCEIASPLDLSPRNVLGERRLPYVDGGVFVPASGPPGTMGSWEVLTAGAPPAAFGMSVTVDTSPAGFAGVPRYQGRVSGERRGALPGGGDFVLWTTDAYVTAESRTTLTLEMAILSAWELTAPPAFDQKTFQKFLDDNFEGHTEFLETVVNELNWGVTWIGVEGTT